MSAQPPAAPLPPPLPPPPLMRPIGPPGGVVAPIGGQLPPLHPIPGAAPPATSVEAPQAAVPPPQDVVAPVPEAPLPPPPPPRTPARTPTPLIDTREEPRDLLQRIGDALWPRVKRLGGRGGGAGWILVVLLFGVTAPIALLRAGIDARVRFLAASAIFLAWLALITGG